MEAQYGTVHIWTCQQCHVQQTVRPLWERREDLPELSQFTPVCPVCNDSMRQESIAFVDDVFKQPLKPVIPHTPAIKHRFSRVPGQIVCHADAMSFCRQRPNCDGRWVGSTCIDHNPNHLVLPSQPCWAKEFLEDYGFADSSHYYGEEEIVPGRKIELMHIGIEEGWAWVYALPKQASSHEVSVREDLRRDYYTI